MTLSSWYLPLVNCLGVTVSSELCGAATTQMCCECLKSRYPAPLARYVERVITRTSLSRSGAPDFFCLAKSSGEVSLVKAIHLPSGDQTGEPAPRGRSVNFQDSPPLIGSM